MFQLEFDQKLKNRKGELEVRIPKNILDQLIAKLRDIARAEIVPANCELKGALKGFYKERVSGYRAIYVIDEAKKVLTVLRIGPRNSVYDL